MTKRDPILIIGGGGKTGSRVDALLKAREFSATGVWRT